MELINPERKKKTIMKAMKLMTRALVKGKFATPEKAELIKQRLLAVPAERMVGVDIRKKEEVEAFIMQEIPEWSGEWLLSK